MVLKNACVFMNGRFVRSDIEFESFIERIGNVRFSGKDASDKYVIPGMIDIHTHGAAGVDFTSYSGGAHRVSCYYASRGVTGFLATMMCAPEDDLLSAVTSLSHFESTTAKLLGINLECPFLREKRKGAHCAEYLRSPDIELFHRLTDAAKGNVKLITISPELEGAQDLIAAASRICRVSLGHTEADFECALRAFHKGADHITHLFNAMPPLLHRSPGLIGAAVEAQPYVELICDGVHVLPSVIKSAFRLFDSICIISDSLSCAGMQDGVYDTIGGTVELTNGRVLTKEGSLAGSCASIYDGLLNAVACGIPLERAVLSATEIPARSIGMEGGRLFEGGNADIVVLNKDLSIAEVYIDGKRFS